MNNHSSPRSALFVGREQEFHTLVKRLDRAAGGEGSVTLICGEAGIGKSRLLLETQRFAQSQGWRVLAGRAYESAGAPPYQPFIEALRDYVLTTSTDVLQAQAGAGSAAVGLLFPDFLSRIPGPHSSLRGENSGERHRLFEAITQFLLAIAGDEKAGLLICLDDLHWADDATLLLLEHVARSVDRVKLLILGTFRDAEVAGSLARTLDLFTRERLAQTVALQRFDREGVREMLARLGVSEPPGSIVAAVFEETEGNPFFVAEMFEYLAGAGRLFDEAGAWRRDVKVTDMDVPQGLRLVIGRRVERLSPECARVLRLAAVVGKAPTYALLSHLAGLDDEALISCLEEAERGQMVILDGDGSLSFAHELIRQTLYGDLSVLRRQRLHLQVANAIEDLYGENPEPHVAAIAVQYRLAGDVADSSKSIDYSIRAGEAAAAVYGWREAETHWEAARELMERTDVETAVLAKHYARLAMLNGRSRLHGENRFGYGERAITLLEQAGDAAAAAKLHVMLAHEYSYWETMDVEQALSHARAAEDALDPTDRAELAMLFTAIVRSANQTFRLAEGEVASLRAIDLAATLDKPEITAEVLRARAMVTSSLGRLSETYELQDRAYDIYDRLDLPEASETLFGRGVIDRMVDNLQHSARRIRLELAKPRLAQSIPLHLYHMLYFGVVHSGDLQEARRIWAAHLAGTPLGNALTEHWLTLYDGKWEHTRTLYAGNWERVLTTGDRLNQTNYALLLGRLEFDLGNHAEAERWLRLGLERSAGRHILLEFDMRCQSAWLYAETARPEEALEHLTRLRDLVAQGEDWHGLGGRYELAEAAFAASEGRWQQADAHFQRAVDVSNQHVLPYQEAKVLHAWGRALAAARRLPAALSKLDAAADLYRQYGAGQPWIDLVEETRKQITGAKGVSEGANGPAGPGPTFGLSVRQREVLMLVARGKTNREIAAELVLSERTVQRHIADLYLKIDVRNRAEAVGFARDHTGQVLA